jgi:hypothetical protein
MLDCFDDALALLAISVAVAAADSAFDLPQFVASCSDTPSAPHAASLSVGYYPSSLACAVWWR